MSGTPLSDAALLSAGVVLRRTQSQEIYPGAGAVAVPFAAYPPNNPSLQAIHAIGQHVNETTAALGAALGQHVTQQVDVQAARLTEVQQAVGAQAQQTYAQLLALHQEQQLQASAQMAMNEQLVEELKDQRLCQLQLVEQLRSQQAQSAHHERSLHEASNASVQQAREMEEMKRRTSARWKAFAEIVPAPVAAPALVASPAPQVMYGFQEAPKAPSFNGSTKVQKRRFMDQYEAYRRETNLANTQRPGGAQVILAPLSSCIDPLAVERIAFWEIGKPSHELVEEDWRVYFLGARECEPIDMSKLDSAMSKLKMDTNLQFSESRVSKLVADFDAILVRLSMEGFAEQEPRMTVDYLVNAIEPKIVRTRVKELLKMEGNRPVRRDARRFKFWLGDYMRRYGEFEPLLNVGSIPPTPKTVAPEQAKKPAKNRLVAVVNLDEQVKKPAKTRVVAVVNVDKVPNTNFTQEKRCCFKCLSKDHGVFRCPKVVEGEAQLLMDKARTVWASQKTIATAVVEPPVGTPPVLVTVDNAVACAARVVCVAGGTVSMNASFDSGADQSVVPPQTLARLQKSGRLVSVMDLAEPIQVRDFAGAAHSVTQEAVMDLRFETEVGPLVLTNVKCWVSSGNLPAGVGDILLSRAIMTKLGYDPRAMLRDAAKVKDEWDMASITATSGVVQAVMSVSHDLTDDLAQEEESLIPLELDACFPNPAGIDPVEEAATVKDVLEAKVAEAVVDGCGEELATGLAALLEKYVDVFRLTLGRDPPVSMPPLKVHLTKDARPVRCKARRYSLPQREFMQKHVLELEAAGYIYRNPSSRWACAPLIVRKPHTKDEFRMTVDLRPVNAQTEQIAWPMPMLEVVVDHLRGATCFFLLDFFKGYWQFALDPSCQEMFSFLTDTGVWTSTRVMQGGSDSVSYCQSTVQEMFAEQLYHGLLAWLDDLLGYHQDGVGLLGVLASVLAICELRGLKLHPKKCIFLRMRPNGVAASSLVEVCVTTLPVWMRYKACPRL